MTEHPITPPPAELVQQWINEEPGIFAEHIATRAAQWGADQELEACCEWLHAWTQDKHPGGIENLRAARRPRPKSLKDQALDELHISFDRGYLKEGAADTIRRALESIDE
jgi:hypothetical protein